MRLPIFVSLGLAVVLLSGCSPAAERARSTPVVVAAFASEEEALAAATEAYSRLLAIGDAIGQEGGVGLDRLEQVAAGTFLEATREGFKEFRESGWRQVGSSKSRDMVVQQLGTGRREVLIVYACDDISGVDVVDPVGVSVVAEGRPDTSYFQVTFDLGPSGLLVSGRIRWDAREC